MFYFSDGETTVDPPRLPSEISKLRGTGIKVFTVGIGTGIKMSELKAIASKPASDHVLSVNNFNHLKNSVSRLSHRLCPGKDIN